MQFTLFNESIQALLKKIDSSIKNAVKDENEAKQIQKFVCQLSERIKVVEQHFKSEMKKMKDIQDTSFAEIFLEKNQIINKLQLKLETMKKKYSGKTSKPNDSTELLTAMNEVSHLKDVVLQQNVQINELMHKLIDAQSYLETLEKEKYADKSINTDYEHIQNHIKIIKKSLLSNRNLLKLIEAKKILQKN